VLPSSIDVQLDLPSGAVPATIDRTQVEQALFGLVLNARDAMPAGGRLQLSVEALHASDGTSQARIGIADSGPGIPASLRERLWMPFFSTKADGSGLGLSFGQAIFREHGGDLRLESPPDAGAVFAAYLPVAVSPETRAQPRSSRARGMQEGRCVLLVEDERLVRATTSRILTRAGYAVVTAEDGEEALAFFTAQPHRVEVVITDLQMPRMSGVDLVTRLRRIRPRLPVIVTSAHPASEQDDHALRAAQTARLRKPFPMTALLETLAQLLDEAAAS
jgi:CheY-like chemotaxis protein